MSSAQGGEDATNRGKLFPIPFGALGLLLALPAVVTARRNTEHSAHSTNLEAGLLREHEAVHRYSLSFAKKAAAFFRMALSIRSCSFSLRSRRTSCSKVSPSPLRLMTASF